MNRLLTSFLLLFAVHQLFAQLHLKLDQLPGGVKYGVYVRPCGDVYPTPNTIAGSGQVTVVFPIGNAMTDFANHAGTWMPDATVTGPLEAPGMVYVSVGLVTDYPKIDFNHDAETMLFSFKISGNPAGEPFLLNNQSDPFNQLPNSANSNPGNEFGVIDFGVSPSAFYHYSGNYNGIEPGCSDTNPQDTTSTNPQDTTTVSPPDTTTTNPQDTVTINPSDTSTVDTTVVIDPDTTSNTGTTTATLAVNAAKTIFIAYPNPASDWIKVKFEDREMDGKGIFRIWTMEGIPLGLLEKGKDDVFALNIGVLPPGLYLVSFEMDGRILQRERFLKK